jgi:uncharacterized SAM-binding protein YcdF (DUF218 family)
MLDLLLLPAGAALVALALVRARKQSVAALRIAVLKLLAVLVAVGLWFAVRTVDYLAGPADGDVYAQAWAFQAIVFALIYLPRALLAAGLLLLAQSLLLKGRRGRAV